MTSGRFSSFLRFLKGAPAGKAQYRKNSHKKAPSRALGNLEILEDRSVPATLYVDLPGLYTITNDTGSKGLTTGDTVTWNGATAKTGLIYGTSAFGTVASAEAASSNNDTIKVNAAAYSDGAVSVPKNGQTFDIPANTTGFSILLTTGSNNSFTLTGAGSINVVGNTGDNALTGNSANNTINAESGSDTITGGAGNDTISGGGGNDVAVFSGSRSNYTVTVSGATVTVVDNRASSPDGTDTLTGVERLKFNGDGTTVRAIPSSLGFGVGTSSKAVATGLVFGSSMIDPDSTQNAGKPTITFQLSGNTTDGYFTWVNDGTVSINGSLSNLQVQGTPAALNAYLNSGNIKYNSLTSATRTITIQVDDNTNANGICTLVANTATAPVFTSANNTSVTYGDSLNFTITTTATPAATYTVTTGTLPSGITLNSTTGVLAGTTAAGTYSFTVTATSGTLNSTQAFTLTVNKVALTVTAAAKSKTYGDADPTLTYSITTGALVGSDSLSGALTRASGESAGTYAISQGTLAASANYTVSFVSANLTVGKAALSISAAAKTKTYGDADPALTYTVSGLKNNDTTSIVTGALTRASGENAGTYAINQGTVAASANYEVTYTSANLTIGKASLTVTAAAKSKTYGDADPSLTYTVSGLKNNDTSSVVTGALTRTAGENVGTYSIGQGTVVASANYEVTYTSANLTIGKASLTVTAAAKSKTYGDADPSLTYTLSGLKNNDNSSVVTGALTRTAGESVGTYAINQGTVVASANYNVSYTSANLTIGKATLTVTAAAKSKTYGDADPSLTYTVSGLKNNDTSSVVTGALTRTAGENVGTYSIGQGTVVASANYNVSYTSADLTISKATLTVTAAAKSKTYGDTDPSLTYTLSGLKNNDASSVVTGALTRTAGESVGAYAINQGTVVASANYNVSYTSANLTIGKASLTVTAAAKSKTYGDADPALTYTVSGLKNNDTSSVVTGALTRTAGESVGAYAINQGTVVASANYEVSYTSANLTIGKASLTVTAAAKSKTYGDADPALTYTVSGLKNNDTASVVTGSLARAAGENAGVYAINQGTVVASANYNVSFTGANLTVGKRAATITANNVTGTYGSATLNNAFTVANMASGETVGSVTITTNATLSGAAKYKAGSWTITPSAATGGNFNANNYTFTYANGTFTVNKATLTVTAFGANKNYDGNTSATVTLSNDDLVGDVVVANAASKTFADATVGFGKTITVSGLTISGADAANYTLASTSTTTTGNIIGSGIVNNKLVIVGTGFDDEIIIAINPKNTAQIYVTWKVNGTTTTTPYSIVGLTGVNVHGGDGNDKLTLNAEVPLTATFYGDAGNDTLRGGNYNDTLYGNDGNDTLYGSLGDDYLDGGAGSDTLNGQDGNDNLIAGLEDNLPNILDGGAGSDTLTGSNGDDTLTGGTNSATDGADTIYGLGGNDKIVGGAGNDIIDGGTGDDNIDGGDGNDNINVGDGNNIVNGSNGDDTIVAGNGNNTLNGNDGNDTITAGNGNNALNGGGGNDTITGGQGNNTVWAGDGNDVITVGNGNNLVIGAMGDDTITAGNGNNILVGEMGNDTITAGSGNNVIVGGGGLDTIKTGNGNNLCIGGSTIYDETDPSLRSILNEWVRTDITTAQKKTNLANGVGAGNAVKLVAGKTVIDDLLADKVFLGTGDNWLWF